MSVGEGYACHIPEDQHEPELLGCHIPVREIEEEWVLPCGDDAFFALCTRVGIQIMSKQINAHLGRDISICLVLTKSSSKGCKEQDEPRNSDFCEHLQI